jgi:FAD/FMN-containing dehydrogenase
MRAYQSWGRYPHAQHTRVLPVSWRSEPPALANLAETVLPFACGRSYGDSCLNDGGALLDVAGLGRFITFDESQALLRCEAGVTLADILALVVPQGWFVPVLPGTRWVSVGGAIANDIHGKNHHRAGTFGLHVTCLELLRSSGERVLCSPERNNELFRATIGGLGLTGLILWA